MNRRFSIRFMNYKISLALEQDINLNKRQLEELILVQRIYEEKRKNNIPDYDNLRIYR